ncbi:MAG TPA: DUF5660 family protein [Patescibacteria group bacterium]|nr:DUF5660 family protein [Patescibacteria group bacterium]
MASTKLTTQIRNQIAANNTIETGKSSAAGFTRELTSSAKTHVQAASDEFFDQLLGIGKYAKEPQSAYNSVDMKAGEEFMLPKKQAKAEKPQPEHRPHIEAGIDYHRQVVHNRERMSGRENQELKMQIQQIMDELQRLVASSDKIVQMVYGDVTVATSPTTVGKYHTNFLSWMLTVIVTARQKVEDSGAWLSVAKGKGNRRGYKNMAKQHGTSFSMSNERQVATQTG